MKKIRSVKPIRFSILVFFFIIGALWYFNNKLKQIETQGWSDTKKPFINFKVYDNNIKNTFKDNSSENYKHLFKYFARGAFEYKSQNEALIYYPGEISNRGRQTNALEGFARFFPLAASWLYSGNSNTLYFNKQPFNLISYLKHGLLSGTQKSNPEYWGDIKDKDQRIVEAADIALALWISKDYIWNELTHAEKKQISDWLHQAVRKKIVDNNWNLFPIIITKSLESLGFKNEKNLGYITNLYKNYKSKHYLGSGWFDDPPKGIDYYNAWSIHYTLFWLDQIDPNFDHKFIKQSLSEFLSFYKYLFSENGFPIMGRSVCYRMAAPAPIISGALLLPEEISPGLALNVLDKTWCYFIKNDALNYGTVSQGYFKNDLRLLDSYSGTGSCLWSLRSLIVAFYTSKHIPLWEAQKDKLPIEIDNYNVKNTTIGWTIKGEKSKEKITLEIDKNANNKINTLNPYKLSHQLKEYILHKPSRPKNTKALYDNPSYSTDATLFIKQTD